VSHLILNQYRQSSGYKDVVGRLYHFPKRYLKAFPELPSAFVYYEPREGGEQVYFGTGKILSVYEDTEDVGHAYADSVNLIWPTLII
jgi:putative restriction endonuclease